MNLATISATGEVPPLFVYKQTSTSKGAKQVQRPSYMEIGSWHPLYVLRSWEQKGSSKNSPTNYT